MDFDQTKKIEVEVSENVIAENEVHARPVHGVRKKRNFAALKNVDILDVALVPVIVGVFVSLGFCLRDCSEPLPPRTRWPK